MNSLVTDEMRKEIFDNLLKKVDYGIILYRHIKGTDDFQILNVNAQADKILRFPFSASIGSTLKTALPSLYDETDLPRRYLLALDKQEELHAGELQYENENGDQVYFVIKAKPLTEELLLVEVKSVSELERINYELINKNKELEQFTYVASHDLQEPLRSISSFLNLLKQDYGDQLDERAHQYMEFMATSSHRMSDLIKDLLDHSRIGQKRKVTPALDINEVVEQIKQDFHSKLNEIDATIEAEQLPTIDCYDVEMRLLLQNLISNGMKFSKPNEPAIVKVSCQVDSGAYHFKVQDNGIGIAPKYQDKIFIIFQRLHSKREYEGTGIGLAHCKKVLDLHKGKIWVESELGKGSTFHFTIPKVLN